MSWAVHCGKSEQVLRLYPDECFDSMVTDPPAGIGFMSSRSRTWDDPDGGQRITDCLGQILLDVDFPYFDNSNASGFVEFELPVVPVNASLLHAVLSDGVLAWVGVPIRAVNLNDLTTGKLKIGDAPKSPPGSPERNLRGERHAHAFEFARYEILKAGPEAVGCCGELPCSCSCKFGSGFWGVPVRSIGDSDEPGFGGANHPTGPPGVGDDIGTADNPTDKTATPTPVVAGAGTKGILAFDGAGRPFALLVADGAPQDNAFAESGSPETVRAIAAARCLAAMLEASAVSRIVNRTHRAGARYETIHFVFANATHNALCDGIACRSGERDVFITRIARVLKEAHRTLKPGAHALVWALPRTQHWTQTACEDAGFEVRDVLSHQFGSGFPKSMSVSKALDAAAGAERKVIGTRKLGGNAAQSTKEKGGTYATNTDSVGVKPIDVDITAPATDAAKQWDGWGTALKPAHESWILCRRPLIGTVAANVLEFGTGGLNVDGCRVNPGELIRGGGNGKANNCGRYGAGATNGIRAIVEPHSAGRWPPNLVLSHSHDCEPEQCGESCPLAELNRQSGDRPGMSGGGKHAPDYPGGMFGGIDSIHTARNDSGGAARFFPTFHPDLPEFPFLYVAKPSSAEKDAGLDSFAVLSGGKATGREDDSAGTKSPRAGAGRTGGRRNGHPTTKGSELMRWLCRLITPPGGTVLDPFAGSGTTGIACALEGFSFHGIELDPYHCDIARARIAHISGGTWEPMTEKAQAVDPKQGSLF